MRITVTGANGLIGRRLLAALRSRGDEVTVLSRRPSDSDCVHWDPNDGPAPADALAGRQAVVHLAGEPVAQRWSEQARRRIYDSRVTGTRNLVAGLGAADPRPAALICASAVGYYGDRGEEVVDEHSGAGDDWLAALCTDWEAAAAEAGTLGMRVARIRTGVVLDRSGGALAQMLPPFRAGLGGPIAGGRQYVSWIAADDVAGMYVRAIDEPAWEGAINATAPVPVTNAELSKTLGRVLRRPAVLPLPAFALRLRFGEMAHVVTTGQRVLPRKAVELGYIFRHAELEKALRAALA